MAWETINAAATTYLNGVLEFLEAFLIIALALLLIYLHRFIVLVRIEQLKGHLANTSPTRENECYHDTVAEIARLRSGLGRHWFMPYSIIFTVLDNIKFAAGMNRWMKKCSKGYSNIFICLWRFHHGELDLERAYQVDEEKGVKV